MSPSDAEYLFRAVGGVIREVPRLTREVFVAYGRGPLLLLPAGLSVVARERVVAATIGRLMCQKVEMSSLVAAYSKLLGASADGAAVEVERVEYAPVESETRTRR